MYTYTFVYFGIIYIYIYIYIMYVCISHYGLTINKLTEPVIIMICYGRPVAQLHSHTYAQIGTTPPDKT